MPTRSRPFTCGLDAALAVIGGKWKPLVLYHLAKTTLRYGELQRAVGSVTHKVLIQQLKELEADGIVMRVDHGEIPPRVDYSLTKLGQTLATALAPLCQWGTDHTREIARAVARRERAVA
ncbi:MAG: helix-turn-helix transcriptional regulator [Myxococcales bacterium]|nr:helix-turn-helix transcriptional regulator [Myxococcales bacterium]